MSQQELEERVRGIPLQVRLDECRRMIGNMCAEWRGPKMSIPTAWDDEDFYIATTLKDAIAALDELAGRHGDAAT